MEAPDVELFTDGACSGNPGPGGWAAILRMGERERELSGGEPATTNNRMELMGAIAALEALKRPCNVKLFTDSVYVKDGATAAIGAGQMSRVDSARIAAIKARDAAKAAGWAQPMTVGSSAASEAFFPFPDGLLAVAEAGATAVIQPGGSIGDKDVIKAADEAGLTMAFTGMRHFRH